jgi:peptidoglycan-associated lipoprotein
MNRLTIVVAALSLCACSHSKPKVASAPAEAPRPTVAKSSPQPESANVAASPHIAVSDELARQCALHFDDKPQAPKFDFDNFELLPEDRTVLEQVATCITSGPMRGHAVQLIGRADPRGTEEYNLGLGTRRAGSVRDYLERLGVAEHQLVQTTRGALDASGTDEAGWRVDRRVDLEL